MMRPWLQTAEDRKLPAVHPGEAIDKLGTKPFRGFELWSTRK